MTLLMDLQKMRRRNEFIREAQCKFNAQGANRALVTTHVQWLHDRE